jgi:hypothetical protein
LGEFGLGADGFGIEEEEKGDEEQWFHGVLRWEKDP